jgi:hypothetical protein
VSAPRSKPGQHNPLASPKGCNGKYGTSGYSSHLRKGTRICERCRKSKNHYRRELLRGVKMPRRLYICGTPEAARRHRNLGQPLDFECKIAESVYWAEYRAKKALENY